MIDYEINKMSAEELERHIKKCKDILTTKQFEDFREKVENITSQAQELLNEYPNCYLMLSDRHSGQEFEVNLEDLTYEETFIIEEFL